MSKIIALWSCPRSVSTAFEVALSQSPKIKIVHEPFTDVYYFSKWRESNRYGEYEVQKEFTVNIAIQAIISKVTTDSVVLFKDMAYQALPYVDDDFLSGIIHTFIVRHPQKVIASWYKINQYPTDWEFGFTALEKMWNKVTQEFKHNPLIIEGSNFRQHPEKVINHYCQFVDVEFDAQMLNWKHGRLEEWLPRKKQLSRHEYWHTTIDNSRGVIPPTHDDVEVEIRKEDRAMLKQAIQIYERLVSESCVLIV